MGSGLLFLGQGLNTVFFSIRWKILIAFLLIFGVSFYSVGTSLVKLVGDSLFQTRADAESATVEALAIEVAPLLKAGNSEALYDYVLEAGRQLGGRLLVLDADGKVQVDTFSGFNGMRLSHPEVVSVLNGASSDSGFHLQQVSVESSRNAIFDFLRFSPASKSWVGYFAAAIEYQGERLGLVLLSISVQDMVDSLLTISDQVIFYFLIAALAVLILTLLFTNIFTRPIATLTDGIRQMGRGNLSTRVKVTGHDELARLAETFNQMSEKLEHLDASRNEFVSNASHELKTPLATMKILLESVLYQEDMEPGLRTEFLSDINKEIDRLNQIVTDLLTLVRSDSKEYKPVLSPLVLRDVAQEAVDRLTPMAEERRHTLRYTALADCPLQGDPIRLQQAVYNLIENAVKYTPEGGKINVLLTQSGKTAILEVSDNGPGIPQKDQAHIFDRFYRVDKARSRATGGNGLGLSIVQQAVLMHGGGVTVFSEEGKGATFRIELPLAQ